MMKSAIYFTSIAFFVIKIFKFLSLLFGHAVKQLDQKGKVIFKFSDIRNWLTNNCKNPIAQDLEK